MPLELPSTSVMKITLAQLNPTIADFAGNLKKAESALRRADEDDADLIVFSELFLTGYPPRDLLERRDFIVAADRALTRLKALSLRYPNLGILVGMIQKNPKSHSRMLCNVALFLQRGEILFTQAKSLLPTYDVFEEARYFEPAESVEVFSWRGEKLGITVCEDLWNDMEFQPWHGYTFDPVRVLAEKKATLLVNISASPFHIGKDRIRYELMRKQAIRHRLPVVFVNQVGGNDELIFDGRSLVLNASGDLLADLPAFEEAVVTVDLNTAPQGPFAPQDPVASVYRALVLGVKDYLGKCGFQKALLGLSGGIDSSVVCAIAVEALGAKNVWGVAMPSVYTSKESLIDAETLAKNLGIPFRIISIEPIREAMLQTLKPHFGSLPEDVTEENIQARIRGNLLMALSNKFGAIPLSTGNKSELSMGYCTLYGDMSGGLSVLADVPKTLVYALAHYINREGEVIPRRILEKVPSAELRPNQKDQDTLPPYALLDRILTAYLNEGKTAHDIAAEGFDLSLVRSVIHTVWKNEFKRRQAAPGLKITSKAFGMGRRMPIAARSDWDIQD